MPLNAVQNAEKRKAISIKIRCNGINKPLSNHVFSGSERGKKTLKKSYSEYPIVFRKVFSEVLYQKIFLYLFISLVISLEFV